MSKGITGGYLPLSVVMTTDTVYDAFYDDEVARGFLHSHSYTGNALACRAALATLDIFDEKQILASNLKVSAAISKAALGIANHPRVRNFRNSGMIWAFDVETSDPSFARNFHQQALSKELLLRPIGNAGNTVYFMPPYVINDEEIALLTRGTLDILNA